MIMPLSNSRPTWERPSLSRSISSRPGNHLSDGFSAATTTSSDSTMALMPEASDLEEDQQRALFVDLYRKSESKIDLIFADDGGYNRDAIKILKRRALAPPPVLPPTTDHDPIQEPPRKKAKRTIDEDDYGDDDDDEEEEEDGAKPVENSQGVSATVAAASSLLSPSKSGSSPVASVTSPGKVTEKPRDAESFQAHSKSSEDARKLLEAARNATEEEVRKGFKTLFYTLEHDRIAMLEQQQLEESEKQLQAEMEHNSNNANNSNAQGANHGTLSSANLGASSLTLKHLIARIDHKRDQVRASDAELRLLINEVRKNRSKWASEENVNQEELYEALEKVLTELKAHTEYSTPFLTRVNKRDAPDYYTFIKQPMDLGSMTKKLKSLAYKSKAEFVVDLNLIWDNCLRYNQDMSHPLRRMANGMRKEAEKLIPLIPDLVIRSRAEVEAEERRKQNGGDDDGGDDSDDEPIMSSRGRTAGAKGANKSRTAQVDAKEETPGGTDQKPHPQMNGLLVKAREGSEIMDGSNGFATPPIAGTATPSVMNGQSGSNPDAMDLDGPSINGMTLGQTLGQVVEQVHEDEEFKLWKQVTKKDRALVARERFALFKDNSLNPDAPALVRTRAGMRRFLKGQRQPDVAGAAHPRENNAPTSGPKGSTTDVETLAEEMEGDSERVIPDYYEPLTVVPDIPPKLQWHEDADGQVINPHEWTLRLVSPTLFKTPTSQLTEKINSNIRQIQETRKLAGKISIIKQMQIQTQLYANQFPKSSFEPFTEPDDVHHFVSDNGPVMAEEACQDALKRSVGRILYHAGFEELQPSAIDALTGIAADYFQKLVRTFTVYREAELRPPTAVVTATAAPATTTGMIEPRRFIPRFTPEEVLLHTLDENGCDIASLEAYAKDDLDRLGLKLSGIHERMKQHLTDLLRPALAAEAGQDGVGAFNDGSEQFVTGDFAEDLGEDFFGFRALGLDKEMGLDMMSVPLHLLQTRVRNQYQMQTQVSGAATLTLFEPLPPSDPVTTDYIPVQIGLVKNFFLAKLHANNDNPLMEDEELPIKQRRPRPRLGATGKIVSPPKRPPKEQIALAKKKKKLETQLAEGKILNASPEKPGSNKTTPIKRATNGALNGIGPNPAALALAPSMERLDSTQSQGNTSQTDREEINGMMSPESIDR